MYKAITKDIAVSVEPIFLPDESAPDDGLFFWAYRVRIENQGGETIQLRRRCWQITDANGQTQEVKGAGVIGEEPILAPGEVFEYTSGTPLTTPSGIMQGTYSVDNISNRLEGFEIEIPAFSLDSPHSTMQVH